MAFAKVQRQVSVFGCITTLRFAVNFPLRTYGGKRENKNVVKEHPLISELFPVLCVLLRIL